jgi:uncharacterized integral membrane protein
MTGDPPPGPTDDEPTSPTSERAPRLTRAGAAWVATAFALLLLVMLIIFILQNPTRVEVNYLGYSGSLPLGMALLIAAVAGGVLVAVAGVTRVTQLRVNARRKRRHGSDG